jgi:hypothetical protein
MALHVAYFQPVIMAMDNIPPVEFSQIYNLANQLHGHPELNDANNPFISIRGGQQIQVYPNDLNLDVSWLVKYLELVCTGYMELVTAQSGTEDLKYCKPVVTSIWTIQQTEGQYQELHTHPGGNLSGNMYISVPDLAPNSNASDSMLAFRLPHTRDVSKFIMNDTWKYKPAAGTIVLFPSYVAHTVYPWRGQGNRTIMAFDAKLVPKDGQE